MFTPRNTLNWRMTERMTKLPRLDSPLNKVSIEIIFSDIHKGALPKRFPKKLCLCHHPFHCYARIFFLFYYFDFANLTLFKG